MTSSPVMTRLPSARARTIRGVSDGIATTSNTVSAAAMVSGSNANWSASGPPVMPIGVTLISICGRRGPSSACHSYPRDSARARPAASLRATISPFL
ncbi:hypothetical protein D3C78_1411300 [compost metagenome]